MYSYRALNLFDRLHLGHKLLLEKLATYKNPVATITDGELVGELELGQIVQPAEQRAQRLREYLMEMELNFIGVEVVDKYSELLDVSTNMHILMYIGPCCDEISSNLLKRRKGLGYSDEIEYLKPAMAQDGDKLASARIRKGEIDREGHLLIGTSEPPRRLQDTGREQLQAPKGDVFHVADGPPEIRVAERIRKEKPKIVVAVGDVTCATLEDQGIIPGVRIVDGITKRGKYEGQFKAKKEYHVYNPPAVIFPEAWSAIATGIKENDDTLIVVDGEEDLLGFPAVLLAPFGSVMVYGQPDVGIVWVPVTKENKSRARAFLEMMPVMN